MVAFVTGASGFVGSALVRLLIGRGEQVRVLLRAGSDPANLAGLDVEIAIGDLCDPVSLARATRGAQSVYHVAADYRLWSRRDEDIFRSNVDGTDNVLRAAAEAGAKRIVYTSSVCTLGVHSDGVPADEETPVCEKMMIGAYKRSKFLAEEKAREWVARGAPIVIVNPSTPIGPRDIKPTPTGLLVKQGALGQMPAYVNTGLNFVHVDDVAAGHLLAHDKGRVGQRYILGGYNLSLRSLLWLIADLVGRPPPEAEIPRLAIYPVAFVAEAISRITGRAPLATVNGVRLAKKLMYFTSAKAQAELGYSFRPLRETLYEAIASFGVPLRGCRQSADGLHRALAGPLLAESVT